MANIDQYTNPGIRDFYQAWDSLTRIEEVIIPHAQSPSSSLLSEERDYLDNGYLSGKFLIYENQQLLAKQIGDVINHPVRSLSPKHAFDLAHSNEYFRELLKKYWVTVDAKFTRPDTVETLGFTKKIPFKHGLGNIMISLGVMNEGPPPVVTGSISGKDVSMARYTFKKFDFSRSEIISIDTIGMDEYDNRGIIAFELV